MTETDGKTAKAAARDLAVPAASLVHLRRAIRKEAGPLRTIHALHDAGFATGDIVFREFEAAAKKELSALDAGRFWEALSRFFQSRGWGRLTHEDLHPGIGLIRAQDWAECDPAGDEDQPGCAFTAGLLAHILGRVADGPVAVLEISCRSRSDGECRFLFGSEGAIHEVYGQLLGGRSLESVLEAL